MPKLMGEDKTMAYHQGTHIFQTEPRSAELEAELFRMITKEFSN